MEGEARIWNKGANRVSNQKNGAREAKLGRKSRGQKTGSLSGTREADNQIQESGRR